MSLIRIDAGAVTGAVEHGSGRPAMAALARLRDGQAPVIVMVHGYRFRPGDPPYCPHLHILSELAQQDCRKAASWPRGLRIGQQGRSGLAFGWDARGSIWQAYTRAEAAGQQLARVLQALRQVAPHRPVHAIGHSLGARVLLSALGALDAPVLDRVLLLAAADHTSHLESALAAPAGRRARLLHVTSGENRAFDLALGVLVAGRHRADAVLGRAAMPGLPELRLDDPAHLAGLAALGHALPAPERRICHWSTYLRPGTLPLYAALTGPNGATLHAEVTRLVAKPRAAAPSPWTFPLPWGAKTPT